MKIVYPMLKIYLLILMERTQRRTRRVHHQIKNKDTKQNIDDDNHNNNDNDNNNSIRETSNAEELIDI